jgi:hypothetical protein
MTKKERVVQSLLRPINPTVIIILGTYTVVWGLWLANPFWTVFTTAPLYSAMAAIFSEFVWGCIAIAAGLVIMRGALKPSYNNLHLGAFVASLHWLVIAIMYFMGDWMNTGGITSLTFFIYSAVVWVNIKINRHIYE